MSGIFGTEVERSPIKSVEWYTPQWIFDQMGIEFDLDPASPFDADTHVPAGTKFTVFDDGLSKPWHGRVWLNPPYGKETPQWINRMIHHGDGIALVFSRTDAAWCQAAMRSATAMLFLSGRIDFVPGRENRHKKSRSGAGTVMFAWGVECVEAITRLSGHGILISNMEVAA